MNKTDKDTIGEIIKQVISEQKTMEDAYTSLISIPEMKSLVDFHGQKLLTVVVRELFETYKVDIEEISFEELARLMITGKVDIPRILGKIKVAVLEKMGKEETQSEKVSDAELARELSEEIVPKKKADKKPEKKQAIKVDKSKPISEIEKPAMKKPSQKEEIKQAPAIEETTVESAVLEVQPASVSVVADTPSIQAASPLPASSSDPIGVFEQAMRNKISDEHIALFVNLGRVVQDKFLKDGDFMTFWNEVSSFMAGDGTKMMTEWKGTTPEFLVVSCGYVIMKKLFKGSKTVKVSKIEFHNAFNINPRSCFRAMFKVNDYLGISEPETEAE